MVKRFFDLIIALIGSFLLLLFFPFLYLIIRVVCGKPVFVTTKHTGRNGRLFRLYRFNDSLQNGQVKNNSKSSKKKPGSHMLKKSPLISIFSGWPQLWNVLKGDLSLIGPASECPEVTRHYNKTQSKVLTVRPGIIGSYYFREDVYEMNGNGNNHRSQNAYIKKIVPIKLKRELGYVLDSRIIKDILIVVKSLSARLRNKLQSSNDDEIRSRTILVAVDILLVFLSFFLAFLLRFDWNLTLHQYQTFLITLPLVLTLRILVFQGCGMYKSVWKYVGLHELLNIIRATSISSVLVVAALFLLSFSGLPRSVFVIDWVFCIAILGACRLGFRLWYEHVSSENHVKRNVLVMGAGDVGEMLIREMSRGSENGYNVVGIVDDNKGLHGMSVHEVRVLGGRENIPELVKMLRVDEVVIAIANITAKEMKSIVNWCKKASVRHRIVPAVTDLLNGKTRLMKSRRVEVADLFGREPLNLNLSSIKKIISDNTILVTGAGGSIGSELCRQVADNHPKSLILVDKNENYLQDIRTELQFCYNNLLIYSHLADITDKDKQKVLFAEYAPDIVFHAAAQKHVPLAEENPDEAVRTNIYGTRVVANLAAEYNATYFVLISTDKAVNPTSLMGATKRVAELYVQALDGKQKGTKYLTVRFGNVFNSNGSVVPTFMKQISRGGPITITHPDIERFFMSIDEAVQLILQSLTMSDTGRLFHLDMGKSIKIDTLAKELIFHMGYVPDKDIKVIYTGLRPGEKLYEELVNGNESLVKTPHPGIKTLKNNAHCSLSYLDKQIHGLMALLKDFAFEPLIVKINEIVPEYTPDNRSEKVPGYRVSEFARASSQG